MSRDEFSLCDKHGLVRNYSMRDDFTIQAKQVEALLVKLEEKIENLRGMLKEQSGSVGSEVGSKDWFANYMLKNHGKC